MNVQTLQYLAKINLQFETPSEEFLTAMHQNHLANFPFSSVAVLLKNEIKIDSESVFNKIVVNQMGGYCFEQNKLAYDVLTDLGFDVELKLARVVYNQNVDNPRTHRISIVTLGSQKYLFDVGFGFMGPSCPVKIELGLEQQFSDGRFRITEIDAGKLALQVWKKAGFFTIYTFDNNVYTEADCKVANYFSHTFPQAAFVNNLVVSVKKSELTYSLRNSEIRAISAADEVVHRIDSASNLHKWLTNVFNLSVDQAVCEFLFNRFCQPSLDHAE